MAVAFRSLMLVGNRPRAIPGRRACRLASAATCVWTRRLEPGAAMHAVMLAGSHVGRRAATQSRATWSAWTAAATPSPRTAPARKQSPAASTRAARRSSTAVASLTWTPAATPPTLLAAAARPTRLARTR
eukprot:1512438-Rhodomonas_salina.1